MVATRHVLMALALGATLLASFVDLAPDEDRATPERPPRERSARAPQRPTPEASRTAVPARRPRFEPASANLFAAHDWQPPPPRQTPAVVSAPLAAAAPPLPFRYVGKLVHDDGVTVFVGLGNTTHVLRQGDVVAGYRAASIAATGMDMVYLRLNATQHLSFGTTP